MISGYLPPRWLVIGALVAALAVLLGVWDHRRLAAAEKRGADGVRAEYAAAAEEQRTRNLELQRAAEQRYVVQAEVRERFIVETITEIQHAAAPLASCALPADAVRLLNSAGRCASGSDPTACGPGDAVPLAR